MKNESNPAIIFTSVTGQRQHLCITGGESNGDRQMATVGIYEELERQGNSFVSRHLKLMVHRRLERLQNGLRELILRYLVVSKTMDSTW